MVSGMAKHARRAPVPKKLLIGSAISAGAVLIIVLAVLLLHNGLLETLAGVFGPPAASDVSAPPDPSSPLSEEPAPPEPEPEPEPVYAYPIEMRGAFLTAGTDYWTSDKDTAGTVKGQIDAALASMLEWDFNTVFVPLSKGDRALYASQVLETASLPDEDGGVFDPLRYILTKAKENSLYVYGVFDFHMSDKTYWDPTLAADADKMVSMVKEAAPLYGFDGYLLGNVSMAGGTTGNAEAFAAQTAFDNIDAFTADAVTGVVRRAVAAIREADRNFYIGLLSRGIWAHKSVDEKGSDTASYYEEMTDGHADTLAWVEEGLFNFVMVKNFTSTVHRSASFGAVLNWWSAVCERTGTPLYISHAASKVGGSETGWNSPSQLSEQLLACRGSAAWKGSAYDSVAALRADPSGSTTALIKAYKGTILSEYISDTLKVTAPSKTTYTTNESGVSFQGSADPNFPLTINGETIELSEHGFFSQDYTLNPGVNTFTLSHKGKTVTYKVTYKVVVLQSMTPTSDMAFDGGGIIIINAVARKGASVSATVGSTKVKMVEAPVKEEDSGSEESEFMNYSGEFELPAGIPGRTQNLGAVTVTASYNGLTESKTGGSITVNALPEVERPEVDLPGTLDGLQTLSPTLGQGGQVTSGKVAVITAEYAETFLGTTTDDYSRPYNSQLPKGTTDCYVKTVYDTGNTGYSYYLFASGRRVYQKDAQLFGSEGFNANVLGTPAVKVSKSHTMLTVSPQWRIPFNVKLAPQKYSNDSLTSRPNYSIRNTGLTADYVDVTFYYVSSVGAAPDFSDSPLIRSAEWIQEGDTAWTLRLHLRHKGAFYGFSEVWDNDGNLHLSFLNPADIASNSSSKPLEGVYILLDPGHGGPYEKPSEAKLNLDYANKLRENLTALGARVEMTRTADVVLDLEDRPALTHNRGYHLLISIHMDAANNSKATGASIHFYSEYGYEAGQKLYDRVHAAETQYGVGTTAAGTPRAEPVRWNTLYINRMVHDMPSVLIECGFQTNKTDMECLIKPEYRDKLMQAVTDGVVDYFSSMPANSGARAASAPLSVPDAAPVSRRED